MDAPSVTLGSTEVSDPSSFPFSATVNYDATNVMNNQGGSYVARATIKQDGQLIFTTDTQFSIVDQSSNQILDSIEVSVIQVGLNQPSKIPTLGGIGQEHPANDQVKGLVEQVTQKI